MTQPASTGSNTSPWLASVTMPPFSTLAEDTQADVCIIGAGISGLTLAYLLNKASPALSIIIIDRATIGAGETGRTTAHLSNVLGERYYKFQKIFGPEKAKLIAESHSQAIQQIEKIVHEEKIDCDFTHLNGYLFAPPKETSDLLNQELKAVYECGLNDVVKIARAPLLSFDTGPALCFPHQGQFHPLKYLKTLSELLQKRGVHIFTNTLISEVKENTKEIIIKSDQGRTIKAQKVAIATNTPFIDQFTMHTKQAAYRTYAIGAEIPAGSIARNLYWDTLDPYHYIRLHPFSKDKDLLIVGGEDHKTGQEENYQQRFNNLIKWTQKRLPIVQNIPFQWSGQVTETIDSIAYTGRNPGNKNIYIVTGDSGNGMTHGTIAGMLIKDLMLNRKNPWAELYDPSRKNIHATGEFLKENLNVLKQYATDYLSSSPATTPENLPKENGIVIGKGTKKLAVYKDDQGKIFSYCAVCPHLGCIVKWNKTEKSWDCPCHGSRFNAYGKLLNGPAASDLKPEK